METDSKKKNLDQKTIDEFITNDQVKKFSKEDIIELIRLNYCEIFYEKWVDVKVLSNIFDEHNFITILRFVPLKYIGNEFSGNYYIKFRKGNYSSKLLNVERVLLKLDEIFGDIDENKKQSNSKQIPPVIGNPKYFCVDKDGEIYSSRGEMLVGSALKRLGVKFQHPIEFRYKETPIYPDFYIIGSPKTIIEYWGGMNHPLWGESYKKNRQNKTKWYNELGLHLIDIEPLDPQNEMKLERDLREKLNIKES